MSSKAVASSTPDKVKNPVSGNSKPVSIGG
jgi:hypothetical protein